MQYNHLILGSILILSGCLNSSSNSGDNGLSVLLTTANAASAAQLSIAAPKTVSGLLESLVEDVPDAVVTNIEARTANRTAGLVIAMEPTREEEACSNGGKTIIEENGTTFSITLENCTEIENTPATDTTPAYASTHISNGTITFSDSTMDGYPDAESVTLNLQESITDNFGKQEHSSETGAFVTGYNDSGYAIKNMNISTHYWGKESTTASTYDYNISAKNFNVTVDDSTDQQSFTGIVTATGTDKDGDSLLGGAFRVDTVIPINNDQTQGEYKISGARNSTVITRLDPEGIFVTVNGASAEFHAWEDIADYFN